MGARWRVVQAAEDVPVNRHWAVLVPLMFLLAACGADASHVETWPEVVHDGLEGAVLIVLVWIVRR